MVPILDMNGKCIAFGGRVLGDAKPKYLNTRETELFDKSHNLFALYLARRSHRRGMILCEGYMDVITQHQAGFDNAVASLGTAFTPGQASLIKRFTKEVYLAYDSDDAGRNAAKKAIQILRSQGMSQRVIDLSPYKDPDEFLAAEGPEAYETRIRDAIPGRLFEIREIRKLYRLEDPEEKTAFIREAARTLAGIEDTTERANYCDTVAEEYGLDVKVLRQEVTRFGMAGMNGSRPEAKTGDRIQTESAYPQEQTPPSRSRKEAADDSTERHLLTWMVNRPELFDKLKGLVTEEDFTGRVREVAEQLFRQYRDTGTVQPAAILSRYEEPEDQRVIAGILSSEFPFETDQSAAEKALTELVRKLKLSGVDRSLRQGGGSALELARKKKEIQKIQVRL
jgi:DNA primase